MTVHVAGGVYREFCVHPRWNEIYGSAGRAALAIAHLGSPVVLHAFVDDEARDVLDNKGAFLENFHLQPRAVTGGVGFRYLHDLATPTITAVPPDPGFGTLIVEEEKVLCFGMLDGNVLVRAKWAVYDPQNLHASRPFAENGSTAERLALVLNAREAGYLAGKPGASAVEAAPLLAESQRAEVVIVKMGPQGAYVWTAARQTQVPAYRTSRVWKIGSGDCFAAHFAHAWMVEGRTPDEAARRASKATAYYCDTQCFISSSDLEAVQYAAVQPSSSYLAGGRPKVYLAGAFFDLGEVWMVEQARDSLLGVGLQVFSPYHDIGLGSANDVVAKDLEAIDSCDLVFALVDGLDPGTVFEIGYARARGIPVVIYSERHHGAEDLKMMEGTDCIVCKDYTTAIYTALWEAVRT